MEVTKLDAPVPKQLHLPQPIDDRTLAAALQIDHASLWHLVLTLRDQYKVHKIPKKSGGERTLHVPSERLGYCQRRILHTFLNPLDYNAEVTAYVRLRPLNTSALVHQNKPELIVVDLKDFFPSTRRTWVKEALAHTFGFSKQVTEILSSLVTVPWYREHGIEQWVVPQGAPTSGAVANIVAMHRLDPQIKEVCTSYRMAYTRYADDLAFSPLTTERRDPCAAHIFLHEIIRVVKASGYRVNYDKIRVQRQHKQQRLLGMVINEKPNVPRRNFRRICALAHKYACGEYVTEFKDRDQLEGYLTGMIAHFQGINPGKAAQVRRRMHPP